MHFSQKLQLDWSQVRYVGNLNTALEFPQLKWLLFLDQNIEILIFTLFTVTSKALSLLK